MNHRYVNGNLTTIISDVNGTKIHMTPADEFKPAFPENIDITVSTICDNRCAYCYAGCSPDGAYSRFNDYKTFIDSIHPFTEVALNVQSPLQPGLFDVSDETDVEHAVIDDNGQSVALIPYLASRNIFVNITVNQSDLENDEILERIEDALRNGTLKGIGVSVGASPSNVAVKFLTGHPTSVAHLIVGVSDTDALNLLADKDVSILLLGYKTTGRGGEYIADVQALDEAMEKAKRVADCIMEYRNRFRTISFDNKALEQLNMRSKLSADEWSMMYQGDEGSFTFAADFPRGLYARSSTEYNHGFRIASGMTVDDAFATVRI